MQKLVKTVQLRHINTEPFTKCPYIQIFIQQFQRDGQRGQTYPWTVTDKNGVILQKEPTLAENTITTCDSCAR